jgi:hypothetical protein
MAEEVEKIVEEVVNWKKLPINFESSLFNLLNAHCKSIVYPATEKIIKVIDNRRSETLKQPMIDEYKIEVEYLDTSACSSFEFFKKSEFSA